MTASLAEMPVGLRSFLVVENKSFDMVGEESGVRVYENGRGYRKSLFFYKEDLEWLLQSPREFRSKKNEVIWERRRRSS